MATSVRASSTGTGSGTAISVAAPTGTTTGDLVVVFITGNTASTFVDNNGATPFTEDMEFLATSGDTAAVLYSRRIQAGDPTTYAFTRGGADRWTAHAVTFQNPHATTNYDVVAQGREQAGNTTTGTTVNITTLNAGSIHCAALANDLLNNAFTALPATYDTQQDSGQQRAAFMTKTITLPGATGEQTFTWTTLCNYASLSFAIMDETGTAPPPMPISRTVRPMLGGV